RPRGGGPDQRAEERSLLQEYTGRPRGDGRSGTCQRAQGARAAPPGKVRRGFGGGHDISCPGRCIDAAHLRSAAPSLTGAIALPIQVVSFAGPSFVELSGGFDSAAGRWQDAAAAARGRPWSRPPAAARQGTHAVKKFCLLALALLRVTPAAAQLVEPNQIGLRMGHVHLSVTDVDAQKQFWVGIMGGTLVKNGPLELIQFPGVYIMLRKTDRPLEPPAGSIVNHFGFIVKDMPAALAKWKAANLKIEPTENPNEVYVQAPDGIRLEVYGEPALPTPVSMNHIHYNAPDIPGIKAWYVKALGANP